MTDSIDNHASAIEAQGALLQDIGRELLGALPADCDRIVMKSRKTRAYGQIDWDAYRPDQSSENLRPKGPAGGLAGRLREAMYQPGTGTWFSAVFTMTRAGELDADFDYDHEPDWYDPIDPIIYLDDLDHFPRDEEHIPEWLARAIAAWKAGVTAYGGSAS